MEPVTLQTARTVLSTPEAGEAEVIFAACQDPEVQRWTTVPTPYTRAHAEGFVTFASQSWADGTECTWAIRVEGALAGMVSLRRVGPAAAEIGFWLTPSARGKGLLAEAASAIIDWGFSSEGTAFERIVWKAMVGNVASARAARALGFRYEGLLRRALHTQEGGVDCWIAGLLSTDDRLPPSWPAEASGLRPGPSETGGKSPERETTAAATVTATAASTEAATATATVAATAASNEPDSPAAAAQAEAATRASYDAIADTYTAWVADELAAKPHDRAVLEAFAERVRDTGSTEILDLGCGSGRISDFLAGQGLEPSGIDLSPAMISLARQQFPHLDFITGSLSLLPYDEASFSGAVAWYSTIHVSDTDLDIVLTEVARVLRPGSWFQLAFQLGSQVDHFSELAGIGVDLDFHRRSLDDVLDALRSHGFEPSTRMEREPDRSERFPETSRQGYLLVRLSEE